MTKLALPSRAPGPPPPRRARLDHPPPRLRVRPARAPQADTEASWRSSSTARSAAGPSPTRAAAGTASRRWPSAAAATSTSTSPTTRSTSPTPPPSWPPDPPSRHPRSPSWISPPQGDPHRDHAHPPRGPLPPRRPPAVRPGDRSALGRIAPARPGGRRWPAPGSLPLTATSPSSTLRPALGARLRHRRPAAGARWPTSRAATRPPVAIEAVGPPLDAGPVGGTEASPPRASTASLRWGRPPTSPRPPDALAAKASAGASWIALAEEPRPRPASRPRATPWAASSSGAAGARSPPPTAASCWSSAASPSPGRATCSSAAARRSPGPSCPATTASTSDWPETSSPSAPAPGPSGSRPAPA